jgi:hypothetical protein
VARRGDRHDDSGREDPADGGQDTAHGERGHTT